MGPHPYGAHGKPATFQLHILEALLCYSCAQSVSSVSSIDETVENAHAAAAALAVSAPSQHRTSDQQRMQSTQAQHVTMTERHESTRERRVGQTTPSDRKH